MYVIESKGVAILLMIISLCLLGTWPALLCLLERRGKKPQHSFLDYSIPNYIVAIIFALTLGNIGKSTEDTPNFATQLRQQNGPAVGFAVAGGVFLAIGNMCTQYSLAYLDKSLLCELFPKVIASSITVVIGTTLNYFLDARINKAGILFPGVGCFLLAVIVGYCCHHSVKQDTEKKLATMRGDSVSEMEMGGVRPGVVDPAEVTKAVNLEKVPNVPASGAPMNAQYGTAEYLQQVEGQRAMKVGGASVIKGLLIVTTAGVCYGLFSPSFNLASNDQWHLMKPGVPHLVIYTTFFYFATGFTFLAWVVNLIFLYKPVLGAPKSSITEWIKDNDGRLIAYAAGIICGLGNGFQFMAGQAAGYAAADATQALPLVSTIWGVVLFGEYRRSSKKTYILLACMLSLFVTAVALLCSSAGDRQH